MKKLILLKLVISLLVIAALMTSCSKENSEIIIEEIEEVEILEPLMRVTIDGNTTESNAYAAYCNDNGVEYLRISNKEVLLDTALNVNAFEIDDFIIYSFTDNGMNFTMGAAVFPYELNGQEITAVVFDTEANIIIESEDENFVVGTMSGSFFFIDPMTETPIDLGDYSVEFTADVIQEYSYCN